MITNPILPAPPTGSSGNAGVTFLQKAIPAAIGLGFVIGVVVFFFMLLIGAIQWISSGGDKQAVEAARGKVSNALIGLVILFALFAILQLFSVFFGVQILNLALPTLTGNSFTISPTCTITCPGTMHCSPNSTGGICVLN